MAAHIGKEILKARKINLNETIGHIVSHIKAFYGYLEAVQQDILEGKYNGC